MSKFIQYSEVQVKGSMRRSRASVWIAINLRDTKATVKKSCLRLGESEYPAQITPVLRQNDQNCCVLEKNSQKKKYMAG